MKKIISIALALITVFALASCGNKIDIPDGFQLASNKVNDYYFFVPTNWTVDMSTGVSSAYFSETDKTNVSMASYKLSEAMSADAYWEKTKSEYTTLFTEMSEPEVKTTALDSVEAKQYTFTGKAGTHALKIMQIFCPKGDTMYVFTYTATPEKFEEHHEKVALIISNFRFM